MKITDIGSGYAGLVTGTCLAELGNSVFCLDVDQAKIDLLNHGGIPIFEPGLKELIDRNRAAGRPVFSTDVQASVGHGDIQFIAVGTPQDENGSADALIIGTEWTEFRHVDFASIKSRLKHPYIFDGRNLYDPAMVAGQGIEYFAVGRR